MCFDVLDFQGQTLFQSGKFSLLKVVTYIKSLILSWAF